MESGLRKISPAIFGVALICFFLPFVNVSCGGHKVASFTGIQLVTGTTIKQPGTFEQKQTQRLKGEPLAIFAFLSVIVGLGLSLLKTKKSPIVTAIIGGIGAVMLLLLKSKMDNDVLKQTGGMVQLEYTIGFWLTFLLNLSAAGLNAFFAKQKVDNIKIDT